MMYKREKSLLIAQINRYCSEMNVVVLFAVSFVHRLTIKFEDRKKALYGV